MNRRQFLLGAASAAAGVVRADDAVRQSEASPVRKVGEGIRIRFLGSGAAGWKPELAKKNPDMRRQSSVLLENSALIDFTMCSFDMLPAECRPEVLFLTHSHGDHYSPKAAVRSGVKRMYVQETWRTRRAPR